MDNLNDLPLFTACDESFAVSNARVLVRRQATAIIGSNAEDAVACFLQKTAGVYEQEVKN